MRESSSYGLQKKFKMHLGCESGSKCGKAHILAEKVVQKAEKLHIWAAKVGKLREKLHIWDCESGENYIFGL